MRLVQLTALAYIVAVVTDVFDDGASAEAAHEVRYDDGHDVDGDLSEVGSDRPEQPGRSLKAPTRVARALAAWAVATDADEAPAPPIAQRSRSSYLSSTSTASTSSARG